MRGIPQGLPISEMLANLYLLEFDERIFEKIVCEYGGMYRRYSDDIVVVCPEEKWQEVKTTAVSAALGDFEKIPPATNGKTHAAIIPT